VTSDSGYIGLLRIRTSFSGLRHTPAGRPSACLRHRATLLLADEAFGHLDEVTSAALRRSFIDLARTEGNTAILVTHQLEEAIELGERILVFGKPGHVLADINLATYPTNLVARLRTDIQHMLQTNAPISETIHPTAKERR